MIKDTTEGQTHSFNDGCGEIEHNRIYRTKLEAYEAGYIKGWQEGGVQGIKEGIARERARAKKKLDPHYNRPVSLKERADREAEQDLGDEVEILEDGIGLGKTKQPSLWERVKGIISLKQFLP